MAMSQPDEVSTLRKQNAQLLALVDHLRGTIEKHEQHIAKLVKR
jgi:hypothetical protein